MKSKSIFLILILFAALTGCKVWGVRGSGDIESETRNIEEFTSLDIGGAFCVKVIVGRDASLKISGDDNLLKYVRTRIKGDRLIIDTKKDIRPREDMKLYITTNELEELSSSGANDILVKGIDSERFTIDLSGAGNIVAVGNADKVEIEISGAGNIDTRELYAEEVVVSLSGACNADVYASEYLDAQVSGVGNIDYYGDPEDTDLDVSGIGSINRK